MLTAKVLHDERVKLGQYSIQESIRFLSRVGQYYEQVIPSNIEFKFIFETEKLLNDLYMRSLKEPGAGTVTNQILEALSQAGALGLAVRSKTLGTEFVRTTKQLGRTLIRISRTA